MTRFEPGDRGDRRQAPYVLDGLLYHATGLSIEEHYTDTGGASDHVFGLMPFFGYRFAPRLRDLKDGACICCRARKRGRCWPA
jgi:TnpA family transposase